MNGNYSSETIISYKEDWKPSRNDFTYFTTKEGNMFGFTSCPTGNCQISSMVFACNIVKRPDAVDLFREIRNNIGLLNILLLDVNQVHIPKVQEIFKDTIISETKYKSTNGSNMVIYLINFQKW